MKKNIEPQSVIDLSGFPAVLPPPHRLARRSFLRSLGLGAAMLAPGAALLSGAREALADNSASVNGQNKVTKGDVAILQFLAAAELIETDLWQQYTELATGN